MPRWRPRVIVSAADLPAGARMENDEGSGAASPSEPGQSSPLGRIVAYIPAEMIAAYHTIQGILVDAAEPSYGPLLVAGAALLVITPFWIAFLTRGPGEPVAKHQVAISTIAFAIWLIGVGNPAMTWVAFGYWSAAIGSIGIVLGGLIITVGDAMARKAAGT
jgi:hypothetical protein